MAALHAPIVPASGRSAQRRPGVLEWIGLAVSIVVIGWFFAGIPAYGKGRVLTTLQIWSSSWNAENDYEHGILFPFVIAGLIAYRWRDLRAAASKGETAGLIPLAFGCLLFVAAYRVIQWRLAAGALPFVLWGAAWFLWGRGVAKILAFPLFFLWLSIPFPNLQQATVHLQKIATQLAHWGSAVFGVKTITQGTEIYSPDGKWEPLSIAGGCSGIRSLMALLMISSAWAYVAKVSLWKKAVLMVSALPLAIIGNGLRVSSIFVIAEYGNAAWARSTWHDWSGLVLFYPFSLLLLLGLHSVLEGGLPWKQKTRRVVRRVLVNQGTPEEQADAPNH